MRDRKGSRSGKEERRGPVGIQEQRMAGGKRGRLVRNESGVGELQVCEVLSVS